MKLTFFIILLCCFAILSCSDENHTETAEKNEEPEAESKIDSSWFYDSLNQENKKNIESYFRSKIQSRQFNGAYLFAENGYIIAQGHHGIKNLKSNDTLNLNTRFQLASGSKPFTATAILKLVEQGKLGLDDSAHHILKELPYKGITVRMLLSHRGGLGKYTSFTEYIMKDSAGYLTNSGILDLLQDTVPKIYYPPNKVHDYSNTGYVLLASIVERVSGKSFHSFMKTEIFDKCGMDSTFIYNYKEGLPTNTAIGYVGLKHRNPGNAYLDGVVGDKGVYSTVNDMLQFDQALYNGFLNDSLLAMATSPQNPITPNGRNYGFGWRLLHPETDSSIVYHTGWWHGYRSCFIRYTKEKKTIVVLDNVKTGRFPGVKELVGLISEDY